LFAIRNKPGKTLVVGASYVALECAGFINSIQGDCTVMVRSILLRGFDRGIAELIGKNMKESHKMRFIENSVPVSVERIESDGKLKVVYQQN
jgi:thioredoxin reductase (NADPH)